MRSLLLLVVALGACDLYPAPKKTPVAAEPVAPPDVTPPADPGSAAPPVAPPAEPPVAPVDAAVAPPFETSAACNDVGVKVAASLIDNADAAQKATLVQERDRIVRRVAEACTRDNWSAASRDCFLKARTQEEMMICGQSLAAPREQ